MHLVLELIQIRQRCSDYDASQGVPNEGEAREVVARAAFSDVLVDFLRQLVAHIENTPISVVFVRGRAQKLGIRQGYGNYVFEHPHVKGGSLEAMAHDEKVDALVLLGDGVVGIHLLLEAFHVVGLEGVRHLYHPLRLDVALLKDQRCIFFHIPFLSVFLFAIGDFFLDLHFLHWEELHPGDLLVKDQHLSGLLRHHIVQLASVVFGREGKVLGLDDMPQNVLSIPLFQSLLVVIQEHFVDFLGLGNDHLREIVL